MISSGGGVSCELNLPSCEEREERELLGVDEEAEKLEEMLSASAAAKISADAITRRSEEV